MFLSVFDIITVPFGYLLDWLYQLTSSYGWALIIFAIVVKVILFPATAKSKRSTMKMSRITPRVQALQKKYANDPQKQNEAIRALYKEEGVSMGGGCLWSLLPLLILIPLYSVIRYPLEYMLHETEEIGNAVAGAMGFAANDPYGQIKAAAAIFTGAFPTGVTVASLEALGAGARTLQGLDFSFLGSINLGAEPIFNIFGEAWKWDWAHIGAFLIPVLSAGSQVLSMFITNRMNNSLITNEKGLQDKEAAKKAKNGNGKLMMWMMPLLSLWIGYSMPAAMSLYWLAQGLISIVMDVYLTKKYRKIYDAEDAARLEKALAEEALEAEKERIRAERRAANPDGITANTSKKKLQQKQQREEAAAKAAAAAEYAAKKGEAVEETQEGVSNGVSKARPNSRGRAYDPNRYRTESTEDQ